MIVASGIAMQFGAKPLFENVNVKFGGGNRYGLIGANGCGKSTFMKILGGELEPTAGTVAIDSSERVGRLRQDQFAFERERVLDVVLMGHAEMWQAAKSRDAIYADAAASEADFMRAADFEAKYAEYGGYTAEARAGALLLGLGVAESQHQGPMSAVAPGWKLRVLLAQALFGDPEILLLDEPTNNLDIHSIRWLEDVLNARSSTMVIISHDRHFLSSVCTHMGRTSTTATSASIRAATTTTWKRPRSPGSSRRTRTRAPRSASPTSRTSCAASARTRPRRARPPRARR